MGQGVKVEVESWEITNETSRPVMFQASSFGEVGPAADRAIIKALLKLAKADDVDIVGIHLSCDGDGVIGTLTGTVGA
jgi:hypothetical protein